MGRSVVVLVCCAIACGRVGFESTSDDLSGYDATVDQGPNPDPTNDAAAEGMDAAMTARADAAADHPCRMQQNWDCVQEGGGDCIAQCAGPDGTYTLEILTFTNDYFCAVPDQFEDVTCQVSIFENCAGCLDLASAECCFQ